MKKLFLFSLLLTSTLMAELIGGVAVVVKGKAVTTFDIKKEMQTSQLNQEQATDKLIRQKLEEIEIKERKISVSSGEVYDDIKKTAERNNMSVSDFYEAVRNSNGMSSSELKEVVRKRLLGQKLYSAIAYTSVSKPSTSEMEEYFTIHKDKFTNPKSFDVVIYTASAQDRLQEKIDNPMFHAPDIMSQEQTLPFNRISPELAKLLKNTPQYNFTPVVPNGQGGFMSFYIKDIATSEQNSFEDVEDQIANMIMGEKREQVLSDYFARLRHNADIKYLRTID